jgi:hypothetical protein
MTRSLQKNQLKRSSVLKQIKVEGEVDEEREVIVRCATATLKRKRFEYGMAKCNKIYEPI